MVLLIEQEIVPIVEPSEAKVLVDVSHQLLIEWLSVIELGQEHEEAFKVLLTIHLNIHLSDELEELVAKFTEEEREDSDTKYEHEGAAQPLVIADGIKVAKADSR